MSEEKRPGGPDLTQDVRPAEFTEGKLFGHVADESASGAGRLGDTRNSYCSRYHGSLADGLVVDDTACFSLRTGEAARPDLRLPQHTNAATHQARQLMEHKSEVTPAC